jgi:cellulose synthase/poly-beta-1,6-N-acetylglucosamine synthase-like glycosyltransferase
MSVINSPPHDYVMSVQAPVTETAPQKSPVLVHRDMVSVVIPCYNEERFIGKALEQLADQFPPHLYEIIVVDGNSTDQTRSIIGVFQERHRELTVAIVDNPARNIPTALNLGISAARGTIIARMDAHAVPCDGYIQRCVEVLETTTNAGAVGMPCVVKPGSGTKMARAIAAAVSHPFGIGDAKYRLVSGGSQQESVDTVAFACFKKSLWSELGGFNESLLTNEDYEFNYRIRQSGRPVILDRGGYCEYFARTTLSALAAQYWRYGGWKAQMLRLRPQSIKLRHAVAPLFVLSLLGLGIAGLAWAPARWLLLLEVSAYLLGAVVAGCHALSRDSRIGQVFLMPIVFATIHLTWGLSFLRQMLRPRMRFETSS